MDGQVLAVHLNPAHTFSKQSTSSIRLVPNQGVAGDAHCGVTVQHRSRVAQDPTQPNLRQVHLLHSELFGELFAQGRVLAPGDLGENITTSGIDLLALPTDTRLHLGACAVVRLTGLRNPCAQIENFQSGLLAAVLGRDQDGRLIRKAGVMAVVESAGSVCVGDTIRVQLPPEPHQALERV